MVSAIPWALWRIPKSRVWFYKPEWHWYWSPFLISHDEFSRITLVLGWPITGRVVIALRYCGNRDCYRQSIRMYEDERRSGAVTTAEHLKNWRILAPALDALTDEKREALHAQRAEAQRRSEQ